MKTFHKLSLLLTCLLVLLLTQSIQADPPQVDITVAQFYYTLNDPTYQSGDTYDVWMILCDQDGNFIASTFAYIGEKQSPGTYPTTTTYDFPGMYVCQGYKVLLWVSKNDLPYGSQGNRTGISSVLTLDQYNMLYPGLIRVNSW